MSTTSGRYWSVEGDELVHCGSGRRTAARHKRLLQALPEDAMPSRPRGDAKERTFNMLIRDGIEPRGASSEEKLIGGPDVPYEDRAFSNSEEIEPEYRSIFGEVLDDHYVIEGKGGSRFLFPFQSFLPGSYEFRGRYKMFNGKILAFLCQPAPGAGGFNTQLIERFYELFNSETGLTLLDTSVLGLARAQADEVGDRWAAAGALIGRHYADDPSGSGALMPAAHQRFQRDLDTMLAVGTLNRRDRMNSAVNVFYVHLALYFQRLAWLLEEEFVLGIEALTDPTVKLDMARACFTGSAGDSPFAGSIQFRVGTGQPRPVHRTDGAFLSYREHNRRQLLLPVNLSVLGAAREVMQLCDRPAEQWTFTDMVAACREDESLAAAFSDGFVQMAQATVAHRPEQDKKDIDRQAASGSPGIEVFREALLKSNRSALRRHGRDIVHGLVHRGGRGYIASRGTTYFFEIGQDLLLLLAKVIVGDSQMPFRQFLEALRLYGLAPQSRDEQDRLADTLRVLNLLEKHSDAGEAMYVKHFL
jgi:hypothetical protein